MKWRNLMNNLCPACSCNLRKSEGFLSVEFCCTKCDFKISESKFETIVADMYKPRKHMGYFDNFAVLQNLGHEKVTEDFSDSPYFKP